VKYFLYGERRISGCAVKYAFSAITVIAQIALSAITAPTAPVSHQFQPASNLLFLTA
jgi:hypothetical protein